MPSNTISWPTVVDSDPKVPFSVATTPCKRLVFDHADKWYMYKGHPQ